MQYRLLRKDTDSAADWKCFGKPVEREFAADAGKDYTDVVNNVVDTQHL